MGIACETSTTTMLQHANRINQPVATWDAAKVTHMTGMFLNANRFSQPVGTRSHTVLLT